MDIKFRYIFKHKKDGDYHFGVFTLNEIENGDAIKDIGYMANDGYILVSRDRYTGLKDKGGKEIYEGDICLVSLRYFDIKDEKAKVIFKNGCFEFQYGFSDEYVKSYSAWDVNSIKVIGNIHDNQELLEVL